MKKKEEAQIEDLEEMTVLAEDEADAIMGGGNPHKDKVRQDTNDYNTDIKNRI